jgi:glycosyltransferase involved in cell wall biosynthesis
LIEQADVYVIPTLDEGRKEGMPMALVEAMAMAIPVLGSDISGINYVLKKFPQSLFNAGNELELRNKLIEMKNKSLEERNSIGLSLRNYCIKNFSLNNFIAEHENLYKSL